MKVVKTNAMRILEKNKINYDVKQYTYDVANLSGMSTADQLGIDPNQLFKTIVLQSKENFYVCCIPTNRELDLKAVARYNHEKKVELLPLKDLEKLTGYVRGGCSPIGMKKMFPTLIDESAIQFPHIYVSAGKRGEMLEVAPNDLIKIAHAKLGQITHP